MGARPLAPEARLHKVYSLTHSHIATHLDINSIFVRNQHVFRHGLSCETQLYEFTTDVRFNLYTSFRADVLYRDFSSFRACILWPSDNLPSPSLSIDLLIKSWKKNFLTDRIQFTVVGNHKSSYVNVIKVIRQGPYMGPFYF